MGRSLSFCFILIAMAGCIEEIPIETEIEARIQINDILIVESTLTDELKNHEVLLSRGSNFGNDSIINFERNAIVSVLGDNGTTFTFSEQEPGRYISNTQFAAQQNVTYQLQVATVDGGNYESTEVRIIGQSSLDAIYAERIIADTGVEGMAIYVDSSNPEGDFNDYRYTFEETYKIIAPSWSFLELEILTEGDPTTGEFPDVIVAERKQEEQTCFNTVQSQGIILSEGAVLDNNQKNRNLVRFINRENAIISHRYSILVKQLLQSPEAAKFYRTLLQFSQNESLFSEIQPGFIEGNLSATNDNDRVVLGYFGVASVVERRLFFDYADFFPNEPLPPYFDGLNCDNFIAPILGNPERDGPIPPFVTCAEPLIDQIKREAVEYFETNTNPPGECQGPYLVTLRPCGDCTALGTNVIPEFWTE